MADARHLLDLASSLQNQRVRKMRAELRARLGEALRVPTKDHEQLDCIESEDLFVLIKPGSRLNRRHFADLRSLLRQAIVAGCAAFETYLAEAVIERVGPLLQDDDPPSRLADIKLDVRTWMEIEREYKRRRRGIRELVVLPQIRQMSSTAPSQVGVLLSIAGVDKWANKIDNALGEDLGTVVRELERITKRRNAIAHGGDLRGRGRAHITADEVQGDLDFITAVVDKIERLLK